MNETAGNTGLTLVLALSYSGREELVHTMRQMAQQVKDGTLAPENIDASLVDRMLYTAAIPDPDLLIRTGGEQRISNFLLWQSAYTEFYFTPVFWPDFRKEELCLAIKEYQSRERRFGKTSEQIALK